MTDETTGITDTTTMQNVERFDIGKTIVISGWAITLLITVATIVTSMLMIWNGHDVPSPLKEWAGMSYGFLFGNLATLIINFTTSK